MSPRTPSHFGGWGFCRSLLQRALGYRVDVDDPKARRRARWDLRAHLAMWSILGGVVSIAIGGLALVLFKALDVGAVLVVIGLFLTGKGAVTRQQAEAWRELQDDQR